MSVRIPWQDIRTFIGTREVHQPPPITFGIDWGSGPDATVTVFGMPNHDGTYSFTNEPTTHADRVAQDFFLDLLRRGSLLLIPKHEGDPDL